MEATSFDQANTTLGPPTGQMEEECSSLRVWRGTRPALFGTRTVGVPVVISCFKVTAEELVEIQRTGRVWLTVQGDTMAPVILEGKSPFNE